MMKPICTATDLTHLSDATRSVHLLKVARHNATACYSRCEVDGYEWEIRCSPTTATECYVNRLFLVLHSEPRAKKVMANLGARLVDPCGILEPSNQVICQYQSFERPSDSSVAVYVADRDKAYKYYDKKCSLTIECTITVLKDTEAIPVPSSNLHQHLAHLLETKTGVDVTFTVSGESFAAHKIVLAARSPVFMAQFFGEMKELMTSGRCIEIKEMEAAVFKAMLGFIYTDKVPELDEKNETTATDMAQHLLVAADRYGLDRLKVICGRTIALSINAGTVATALALAEQHGCSQLKVKCVEFITGGTAENLGAILATEGFKRLEASSPSVVTELLVAAHRKINK